MYGGISRIPVLCYLCLSFICLILQIIESPRDIKVYQSSNRVVVFATFSIRSAFHAMPLVWNMGWLQNHAMLGGGTKYHKMLEEYAARLNDWNSHVSNIVNIWVTVHELSTFLVWNRSTTYKTNLLSWPNCSSAHIFVTTSSSFDFYFPQKVKELCLNMNT